MRKLIENGEYFKQARAWYNEVYLLPFIARSASAVAFGIIALILASLVININLLFPLDRQIRYAINVEDTSDYVAKITSADFYKENSYKSIARIFLETYIEIREGYDYDDLANRMLYIQNTSTKVMYNKYNNYLSLDNPDSPVLKLQRYAKRIAYIKSVNFIDDDNVVIIFNTKSFEDNGKNLEDTDWEANISFIIDKVDLNLAENTPFNFIVSDYKVKLIRDNNAK